MPQFIDLSGKRFGRLTVISRYGKDARGKGLFKCQCNCGKQTIVRSDHLTTGKSKSCGCFRKELSIKRFSTHSLTGTKSYVSWAGMIRRCEDPKSIGYARYGGRGIVVCKRWRESFEAFLEDIGPRPPGMTLERKNNNLGYFKDNCKWATPKEQANNRRSNRINKCKQHDYLIGLEVHLNCHE